MSIKNILAVSSAFIAASAIAQASLGTVASVQGNVTVASGNSLVTATQGAPITSGMRFVTPSNGVAVLRLNNGCVVNLRANQAVTVLQSMTCDQLLAGIQNIGTNVAGAAGGSAGTGALASGGLLATSWVVAKSLSSK